MSVPRDARSRLLDLDVTTHQPLSASLSSFLLRTSAFVLGLAVGSEKALPAFGDGLGVTAEQSLIRCCDCRAWEDVVVKTMLASPP